MVKNHSRDTSGRKDIESHLSDEYITFMHCTVRPKFQSGENSQKHFQQLASERR